MNKTEYSLKEFSELLGLKYGAFVYHKNNKYPEINKFFYKKKIKGYWYYFISVEDAKIVQEYIRQKSEEEDSASWTQTAIECYERHCICFPTCSSWEYCKRIQKELGYKPIKNKVIELVKEYGVPIRRD